MHRHVTLLACTFVMLWTTPRAAGLRGVLQLSDVDPGKSRNDLENKEGKQDVQPFENQLPKPEETGRFISDHSWDAADHLLKGNATRPSVNREIVAVLGSFKFEGPSQEFADSEHDLGEAAGDSVAGPAILMPSAARAQIRAAEQLITNKVHDKEKKKLAKQYLMNVRHGRNQLESATIQTLSTKLAHAQKKIGVMIQVEAEAKQMLADPKAGTDIKFNFGTAGKVDLKIEGWQYADGHKFYAPQGMHASVQACKRFMAEHIDKELVLQAMKKRDAISKQLQLARGRARNLAAKANEASEPKLKKRLGASKEISESSAQKTLNLRQMHEAQEKVKGLQNKYDAADELVLKRQQQALNAASNYVRDADFRAREEELTRRERKLNERETRLRSTTEQLEATAEALKKAHETKLVVDFPAQLAALQTKQKHLIQREQAVKQRETSLAEQAKIMKAKIHAFNTGVAETIENSVNQAPVEANKWNHKAKLRISSEVDDFQHMLTAINDKFSTGHGSKIADQIAKSVTHGVNEIKQIKQKMDNAASKAARDGAASAHRKPDADKDVPAGGLNSVDESTNIDGTLDDGKVQQDGDVEP